jgi:hypothetical protein
MCVVVCASGARCGDKKQRLGHAVLNLRHEDHTPAPDTVLPDTHARPPFTHTYTHTHTHTHTHARSQSVSAAVLARDAATGRFSVSLKPSVAGAHEGAYVAALAR